MKSRWSISACVAVVAGTTGFLAGFLMTLAPAPLPQDPGLSSVAAAERSMPIPVPHGDSTGLAGLDDGEPMYFPQTVLADAEALVPDDAPSLPPRIPEPGILPHPASEAAPIPARRSGLEQLIDAEFSGLSDQQREIWLEVLGGLPLEDAAGILRMWKQMGRGNDIDAGHGLFGGSPGGEIMPQIELAVPPGFAHTDPALEAIRRIRHLVTLNLLNAETHGYRRYEPLTSNNAAEPGRESANRLAFTAGVSFDGWRIDQRPGEIQTTGNSLDVAISGDGFFVVQVGAETLYTRCGRLRMNAQRRLVLDVTQQSAVVQPELSVPPDSDEVSIAPDGTVHAVHDGAEPRRIGRLQLATFRDPGRLQPAGSTLFRATADSGPARLCAPSSAGTGSLQQRALESSNVDFEEELSRLEWLDRLARSETSD